MMIFTRLHREQWRAINVQIKKSVIKSEIILQFFLIPLTILLKYLTDKI